MKRLSIMACAGLLSAAMAGPSLAADLPRPAYKAPVYVAPAFSWTGTYVGINGGYGWGDTQWQSTAISSPTFDANGWLVGATLGYNLQTGVWVWGIEGDFAFSDFEGENKTTGGICSGTNGCRTEVPWFATVRGRIGYSFGRFLPYITGGAAFADVKLTPNGGATVSNTEVGWTLGGGLEYAFMGPWSAKIEYLYADLGESNCPATTCGVSTDVEFTANIVRVGVNYRF